MSNSASAPRADLATRNALWIPTWYELDPSLEVGQRDRFRFYATPPSLGTVSIGPDDLVFYNQLPTAGLWEVREATVSQLEHEKLGPLQRIATNGLDYIFFGAPSGHWVVNAEERPGTLCDGDGQANVDDWSVRVKLQDVSEPLADTGFPTP